jgi:hypothetical protein
MFTVTPSLCACAVCCVFVSAYCAFCVCVRVCVRVRPACAVCVNDRSVMTFAPLHVYSDSGPSARVRACACVRACVRNDLSVIMSDRLQAVHRDSVHVRACVRVCVQAGVCGCAWNGTVHHDP